MPHVLKILIVSLLALLIHAGCTNDPDIPDIVQLLKADDKLNADYVVNPLAFLETKVAIPGPTFNYERGDDESFEDGIRKIAETEVTFEKVDSAEFLQRVATISETIRPELKGRIRVNEDYKKDHVNIFFLSSRFAPKRLRGACAYVGFGGVILCDGHSLTNIINELIQKDDFLQIVIYDQSKGRKLKKEEMDKETLNTLHAYIAGGFLSWVVAHEIGHYVNDYKDVEEAGYVAHFQGTDLLAKKEIRADQFAANSIKETHLGTIAGISLLEFMAVKLSEFSATADTLKEDQKSSLRAGQLPNSFSLELDDTLDARLLIRAASVSSTNNFENGGFSQQVLSSIKVSSSSIKEIINWSPYLIVTCLIALGIHFVVKYNKLRGK